MSMPARDATLRARRGNLQAAQHLPRRPTEGHTGVVSQSMNRGLLFLAVTIGRGVALTAASKSNARAVTNTCPCSRKRVS